jgi:type VI secretion system protein ImpL
MKDLAASILKIALWVFLALIVVLVVFGLVLWLNWPLWVGLFLLLGLAALGVALFALMKVLSRRKEQHFVQQVIEQDEVRIKNLSAKERDEVKVLQERWKEAVETLKRSHLRKLGNPLYVLPWYMVIGESGSGKTTAINSAKLSSPFVEVKRVQGISGTKNCDWWFFEQAVIIDTAGRYAIPVDEGKDKDEWQKFLSLLLKYRKKEPLHGLIVTVPADKLLAGDQAPLEDDGKNIRRRIEELMRVLGIKFPVYVLVTKCDLIQGMTGFSDELPEKMLNQPMGFIKEALSKDVSAFLETAMKTIGDRLRNIRLLLLNQPRSKAVDPAFLLFPEEFDHLRKGLDVFMRSAFQENPYQETPILRGLFFSSGHQEGTPYSHFLEALGLIEEKQVLPGTNKGLFLNEFFARILPADRKLFAPTTRSMEWQKLTRNLGFTAWILFALAMCGLLSLSFVKNLNSIRTVSRELANRPATKGDSVSDLVSMERFRQAIVKLEGANSNWWIPRFGLKESDELERGLKDKFCKQFREGYLIPFDRHIQEVMPRLSTSAGDSEEVLGQYIVHLVRRINLLGARMEQTSLTDLAAKPQPSYVGFMGNEVQKADTKKQFANLYLSYISWRNDGAEMSKETAILQAWLKELLRTRGSGLQWLIRWVDKESGLPAINLAIFWGGSATLADEPRIGPAFTVKGKSAIEALLKELEAAISDPAFVQSLRADFDKRYRAMAYETWRSFAAYFSRGAERLKGAREWHQIASLMAGNENPYSSFLNRTVAELEPFLLAEDAPPWLQQASRIKAAKVQAAMTGQGSVAKMAEQGMKIVGTLEKKMGGDEQAVQMESQATAAKSYRDLTAALGAASAGVASRNQSYQSALQVFTEDPGASKSPFYAAQGAAARLRASVGWGRPSDDVIARLVNGPVDFLWTVARMETGCYLQAAWEEKVLAEAQGTSGQQAAQVLLSPDGPVWKFVKSGGTAAPFIGWNLGRGYYPKEAMGSSIPFDPTFFQFLVKGAKASAAAASAAQQPKQQGFNVTITGMPTDTNQDAKTKPHSTKLEMQCATGIQSLMNMNYPVKKTFTWSPDSCADVTFQIEVGNTTLTKRYAGPEGFSAFLADFKTGKRVFNASEFPQEKANLDSMGVKYIDVNYQFSGAGAVLSHAASGAAAAVPGTVARSISRCWAE